MFLVGWAKRKRAHHRARNRNGGHATLCPPYTISAPSMQPEHAVDGAQFGRLDQLGMRHRHREQRAIEFLLPENQKVLQRRKLRKQIVVLPDIGL